jgi:hypothetical protein
MSSDSEHWNTPDNVLELVRRVAAIGLDPCSNSTSRVKAAVEWQLERDGDSLQKEWRSHGLVFVNPPYGRALKPWATKMHYEGSFGASIIGLVPARTDTAWFEYLWSANALCFWYGRLKFSGAENSAPFPSCLPYWGPDRYDFAHVFHLYGRVIFP